MAFGNVALRKSVTEKNEKSADCFVPEFQPSRLTLSFALTELAECVNIEASVSQFRRTTKLR